MLFSRNGIFQARFYKGDRQYIFKSLKTRKVEEARKLAVKYLYEMEFKQREGLPLQQKSFNNVIDEYKNIHKPNAPAGTKVLLEVGDMLVYSGCELEHWREPFDGNICGQVFLHYNHVNGPFADKNRFDGRAKLGLPSGVK
mgnify:CR=1 FL=1